MAPLYHDGRKLELAVGESIFDYADTLKIRVPTSCARTGKCHECIVDVRRGTEALSGPTEAEKFLRDSYRLACQARVLDAGADIEFAVLRRQPRILTESIKREVELDPLTVRQGDGVFFDGERIDDYRGRIFGLAIDVGTTTVVLNLVDLETGKVAHTASFENPQRFGGSDIMHRISYDGGEFQDELRQVMLSSINFEIGEMTRQLGIHRRLIYEVVAVGNATMRDLLFGLDVQPIGQKPYKSVTELEMLEGLRDSTTLNLKAKDAGLRVFPKANVYGGPLIGSHVGADVAADLLAVGMDIEDDVVMLVDVGTNTEVVVGNRNRMMAASCPAGPAFEGGEVTYGMPGYDGAIESVNLSNGVAEYRTIGGVEPQGICGSGLVDLLAELRRTDKMTELGVFKDGNMEFPFAPERGMSISRADISALAQAKSANYSGQYIVLRNYGVQLEDVTRLYLAGGFANYVSVENAVGIGFIAAVASDRVVKAGNASLEGATLMLVSRTMRRTAEEMVRRIEHVELETTPDFFDIFVEGCMFNPMKMADSQ
ncbi:MAG: ASKHA domain-containing protein [Chloroflexi bacterium]|nr:ASKHA domain-containing protein [Chloroflexota bacterium]